MGLETPADLALMLSPDDFGATASITPVGGSAGNVNGIFDQESQTVLGGGDFSPGVILPEAVFTCAAADVFSVDDGAACRINGADFTVKEKRLDETGRLATLSLERNA